MTRMAVLRLLAVPQLFIRLHVCNIAKTVEWVLTEFDAGELACSCWHRGVPE